MSTSPPTTRLTIPRSPTAAVEALVTTRTAPLSVDLSLIAVRTALAWIFIYYGAGKLFDAFDGPGLHQWSIYMSHTAHLHPGGFFAVVGAVTEFGGGVAMALGVASRLAALALLGDMVMAMITVSWAYGFNSEKVPAGYEFNVALAAMAAAIVLLGAGRFSVDALAERWVVRRGQRAGP